MVKKIRTRLTKKAINEFKITSKYDEPSALGANFVYNRITMANALNWYNENGDVKQS